MILHSHFSLLVALISVEQCTSLDLPKILGRQDVPLGTASLPTTSNLVSTIPETSESPSSASPSSTPAGGSITSFAPSPSTSATVLTSTFSPATSDSQSFPSSSPSNALASTESTVPVSSSLTFASFTERVLTTILSVSGSSTVSSISTSSRVVAASSSSTAAPGLNGSNDNNNSSGLSSTSKKIIGGVVGGIGGAILLGGLAIVLWRLRARERKDDTAGADQLPSNYKDEPKTNGGDPFRSHLDQTHAPVNTASNF